MRLRWPRLLRAPVPVSLAGLALTVPAMLSGLVAGAYLTPHRVRRPRCSRRVRCVRRVRRVGSSSSSRGYRRSRRSRGAGGTGAPGGASRAGGRRARDTQRAGGDPADGLERLVRVPLRPQRPAGRADRGGDGELGNEAAGYQYVTLDDCWMASQRGLQQLSAEALAAAGVAAGNQITAGGVTFTPGQPDNVILQSQTVVLSGSGSKLGFIGSAAGGTFSGTGTVYYTDGTTQSFTIAYANWISAVPSAGDDLVAHTSYFNRTSAGPARTPSLFAAYVPLDSSKTLEGVQLPSQGDMHVFTLAVG